MAMTQTKALADLEHPIKKIPSTDNTIFFFQRYLCCQQWFGLFWTLFRRLKPKNEPCNMEVEEIMSQERISFTWLDCNKTHRQTHIPPLWCSVLRHCRLGTCQTQAVWSSEPDSKRDPSMFVATLSTCLLQEKGQRLWSVTHECQTFCQ